MTDEQLQQILTELRNINDAVHALITNTGFIAGNTSQALEKLDHLIIKTGL